MPNDFENRNKAEILKNIEDPHQKDIANAVLTSKDIAFVAVTGGAYPACLAGCAYFLTEAGDHLAAMLCYTVCAGFLGVASYSAFRKIWQMYSIPAKDYLVRIALSLLGGRNPNT